ncbi:hypothetical protein L1D13_24475 [Vibrio tubiashii]|uniref:hypothetical protein n=1 Tax=Vibrio tubiashii TaxID=29498 RepID=UPI001EFD8C78|nr:hypothetical protein [Vibrio tubiashii]MCG9584193.1 hypothetical protein [Vibrio tubiashii]MCG9617788.1 hypothetical protein [Vibrio tubiashii]MCG9690056.1 hypothetical protein [Vibrio tubiashii]
MKKYFTLLILLLSFGVSATEESPTGLIKRIQAYSVHGDIFISMETNGQQCSTGYYIDKVSPGYESILSMLLAAYQANINVVINGYVNNRWSGSSEPVCEIFRVAYMR